MDVAVIEGNGDHKALREGMEFMYTCRCFKQGVGPLKTLCQLAQLLTRV